MFNKLIIKNLCCFRGKYLLLFGIYYKKSIFIRTQPAKVA